MPTQAQGAGPTRLLERELELAAITHALETAARGEAAIISVEGPAGIGKTALLQAAASAARNAGLTLLRARASPVERDIPFAVAGQLLTPPLIRAGERRDELLRGSAGGAASALLGIHREKPLEGATTLPSGDRLHAALHGLFWLVVNLTEREGGLALVADDLHWSDEPSIRFLSFLAQRAEGLPLLVACGVRTGENTGSRGALDGLLETAAPRLRPGALSSDGTREIVARYIGRDAEPSFASACHDATGGNPFLAEELGRVLSESGVEPTAEAARSVSELAPGSVAEWVRSRLARQGDTDRSVAHAVAVLGERAELRLVAELANVTRDEVARAAARLADAQILSHGTPLAFVHPLVATAVHEALSPLERALAHERAAALLAEHGASSEQVAAHLLLAEPAGNEDTAAALLRAARDALDRGAPEAAARYVKRARAEGLSGRMAVDAERLAIHASVRFRAGRASLEAWLKAVDEHPELLLDSAYEIAIPLIALSRHDEAVALLLRAADVARGADRETRLRVEAQLVTVATFAPGTAELISERLEASRPDWPPRDAGARAIAAMDVWWTSLKTGTATGVADAAEEVLDSGLLEEQGSSSSVYYQLLWSLIVSERFEAADRHIAAAFEHARRAGSVAGFVLASVFRSFSAGRQGDVAFAEAETRAAFEAAGQAEWLVGMQFGVVTLFAALVERDPSEMAKVIDSFDLSGDLPGGLIWQTILFERGRLRLLQGRRDEGLRDLLEARRRREAWGFVNPAPAPCASYAAPALVRAGRREEALELVEQELARAEHWGAPGPIGIARRARALVIGGEEGLEDLDRSVSELERSQRSLALARSLVEQGAMLRRLRRRADAREPLRRALVLARRGGGMVVAKRAREELAATGEKMSRADATAGEPLTPSERRIAGLAAGGMKNREIAESQFLTLKTVEMHLRNAYRKLGIASRAELPGALERQQAQGSAL